MESKSRNQPTIHTVNIIDRTTRIPSYEVSFVSNLDNENISDDDEFECLRPSAP